MKAIRFFILVGSIHFFTITSYAQLLISEYVEGSLNNKGIELWNTSSTPLDLTGVQLEIYGGGSSIPTATISLTGIVQAGDVFVLANPSASFASTLADQTSSAVTWSGDDAIVLRANGIVLDSIGQVGFDPGTAWGTGLTSTADHTLRRRTGNLNADTVLNDAYDPAITFTGFPSDTFNDLGVPPAPFRAMRGGNPFAE